MENVLSKIVLSFSNLFFLNKYFGIGNEIGDEGIKYLSELVKSNNSIQTLYLGGQ